MRLINIGISDYVVKTKRVINEYSLEEFEELMKKVKLCEVKEKDFKSKYKRVVDVESNLNLFKKIINEIPRGINYLVLLGVKKGNSEILDVINEKFELKEKFKNCFKKMNDEDLSRFSWMNKIIGINKLERVEFKLGKVK